MGCVCVFVMIVVVVVFLQDLLLTLNEVVEQHTPWAVCIHHDDSGCLLST